MTNLERYQAYLPIRRVLKLASAVLVLNSVGLWVVVSLPDWPNLEFSMELKLSDPSSEVASLPASPAGLSVQ